MNIGILLATGDSFDDMKKSGQDERFKKYYLDKYSKAFDKVYIFSYANERVTGLPKNVILIPNSYNLHRYLYGFLLPFLNMREVIDCEIVRAFHLSGTLPAIVARIIFGKKYVFNYAYDYPQFAKIEKKSFQYLLFNALKPFAIFFASKILAANRQILKNLPKNKSVYLPNGVDVDLFKPNSLKKMNKIPTILSVGRLERQKNFEFLINALKGLNVKLKIVGSGSLKDVLIRLAKKNKVNLEIKAKITNSKMPYVYQEADIFVLPSKAEGSPKTLIEAMSCGLIVVTTTEAGSDIVSNKKNAFTFHSAQDLRRIIEILIGDNKLAKKAAAEARKNVVKRYNLSTILNKEIMIVKNL